MADFSTANWSASSCSSIDVALGGQPLAVLVVFLGAIEVLFGDEHLALDRLPLLDVRAVEIFLLGDQRRLVHVARLDDERLGRVDGNLLRVAFLAEERGIELHQKVAVLQRGAFGHDLENRDARGVLGLHFGHDVGDAGRLDFAALGDREGEVVAGDLVKDDAGFDGFVVACRRATTRRRAAPPRSQAPATAAGRIRAARRPGRRMGS